MRSEKDHELCITKEMFDAMTPLEQEALEKERLAAEKAINEAYEQMLNDTMKMSRGFKRSIENREESFTSTFYKNINNK